MTKKIISIIFLFSILLSCSAEELGERIYKEITLNGEKYYKWLTYSQYTEFDEKGIKVLEKDKDHISCIHEYNSQGFLIHSKFYIFEDWYEYDLFGNCIKQHSIDYYPSKETWKDFDINGNCIHEIEIIDNIKNEIWSDYNSKGKVIHKNINNKEHHFWDYDKEGNEIHYKGPDSESWEEYDKNGNIIHRKFLFDEYEYWYDYDSSGNLIHSRRNDGYEAWTEYDTSGNEILFYNNEGYKAKFEYLFNSKGELLSKKVIDTEGEYYEYKCEYDINDKIIYLLKDETEYRYEYDLNGNLIHYNDDDGEYWYNYDIYGNSLLFHYKTNPNSYFNYEEGYEYEYTEDHRPRLINIKYKKENEEINGIITYENDTIIYQYSNGNERIEDLAGQLLYEKYDHYEDNQINGKQETWYNSSGNIIHYKDNSKEYWNDYDSENRIIHYKDNSCEYWTDYDKNGNEIHTKSFGEKSYDNYEYYYEYEFYSNGKIKTIKEYKSY